MATFLLLACILVHFISKGAYPLLGRLGETEEEALGEAARRGTRGDTDLAGKEVQRGMGRSRCGLGSARQAQRKEGLGHVWGDGARLG